MTALFVWTISAFGLAWIVADSKISFPLRMALDRASIGRGSFLQFLATFTLALLECVACTGTHLGWVGQLAGLAPFEHWYVAAFFTCGSNLILAKVVGLLDPPTTVDE